MADTRIQELVINELTKAQYDAAEKDPNQLYMVPDANPDYVGDLSSLLTTAKDNLVNAINEVKQGGGGGSEWEKLVDYTSTAESTSIAFLNGDNGQVFDDYQELFLECLFQPMSEGITETRVKICFEGNIPWDGRYWGQQGGGYTMKLPLSTEKSKIALSLFKKTPFGIVDAYEMVSLSHSSVNNFIGQGTTLLPNMQISLSPNAIWSPSDLDNIVLSERFEKVLMGGYGVSKFNINTRIIIYGKK